MKNITPWEGNDRWFKFLPEDDSEDDTQYVMGICVEHGNVTFESEREDHSVQVTKRVALAMLNEIITLIEEGYEEE